jgi:iron(III) transport system ATP-binding protein
VSFLRIQSLYKTFNRVVAVNQLNLEINEGEFFTLLGSSGCGKTTTLRLVGGLEKPDGGEIYLAGKCLASEGRQLFVKPEKRHMGMVFQSYALWPHMTVARNVAFGLQERRVEKAEIARRVEAALKLVGLSDLAGRRPSQLSGGQQQRVALARTIAVEPKILLLDEPLSNLDAKLRIQVRRELRELQQRLGLTTILVTHDQEEANTICDRVAVMNAGVVQQVGTPTDIYERPNNLFVANFLGTANIIEGRITGDGSQRLFEAGSGLRLAIPPGTTIPAGARMMFRPQDARVVATKEPGSSVAGTITFREFLGASVRYGIRAGAIDLLIDAPFHSGDKLHDIGQPVAITIPMSSVRWLAA